MLVLFRKRDQAIRIGEAVVTVTEIGHGGVRLGIEAPAHVKILRDELEPFLDGEQAAPAPEEAPA